jgi:hypothetical protein
MRRTAGSDEDAELPMREGWHHDEYLMLLGSTEVHPVSGQYAITRWLPGYRMIGVRGWDELLVQDQAGRVFSVPAIPIRAEHLEPFDLPPPDAELVPDSRFSGKIKWYLQPLVFGGSPSEESNIHWVTLEQHAPLVVLWNDRHEKLGSFAAGA